jgi:hypothetical protein
MASTYSSLKFELIGTGEQDGTWGDTTNVNLGTAIEQAITGSGDVTFSGTDITLTLANSNSAQVARNLRLVLVGTSSGARQLVVPSIEKLYIIKNELGDTVTVKTAAGTGIGVPSGKTMFLFADATNVVDVTTFSTSLTTSGNVSVGGTLSAASPDFTGTPTAPSAANGTNTTQIATTAFVNSAVTLATGSLGTMSTQNANAVAITGGTISGITNLAVADGGTGRSTLAANAVLIGNGTSGLNTVAPGTSGNVLTSNGTAWSSTTPAVIGVGQTWQNVIGSRAAGTTYTNSTGKPIMVSVSATRTGDVARITMVVDGITVGSSFTGTTTIEQRAFTTAIVPNGSTYLVQDISGSIVIWAELR